jgi:predicted Rossmann fold nucleotide-binding protein DprA/Smf involved in DNA uptake
MASRLIREGTANQVNQAPGGYRTLCTFVQDDPLYPSVLLSRLGGDAPARLFTRGNQDLLLQSKTALFCSARCPGEGILAAYDQAARWRDEGRCIISGFHSPVEKECLRILLRGRQPIVICPARSIENMRIPRDWRTGIEVGRLLLVSPFAFSDHRVTATLAEDRNEFVAALAAEVCLVHVSPGGKLSSLADKIRSWGIPFQELGLRK